MALKAPKAPRAPWAPRKPRTAKPSTPTPKKVRKATTKIPLRLQEILDNFKTLDQDPFQPEEYRQPCTNLPSSFLINPHSIDYFNLFLTNDLINTITTNSNRYAAF